MGVANATVAARAATDDHNLKESDMATKKAKKPRRKAMPARKRMTVKKAKKSAKRKK